MLFMRMRAAKRLDELVLGHYKRNESEKGMTFNFPCNLSEDEGDRHYNNEIFYYLCKLGNNQYVLVDLNQEDTAGWGRVYENTYEIVKEVEDTGKPFKWINPKLFNLALELTICLAQFVESAGEALTEAIEREKLRQDNAEYDN